jgi:hypothetical protein
MFCNIFREKGIEERLYLQWNIVPVKISGKFVHISTLRSRESWRDRNWTQISRVSFVHTGIRADIWAGIVRLRVSRVHAKQDSSNLSIDVVSDHTQVFIISHGCSPRTYQTRPTRPQGPQLSVWIPVWTRESEINAMYGSEFIRFRTIGVAMYEILIVSPF